MPRYTTIAPRADYTDDNAIVRSYEVESIDSVATGLVDIAGKPIYRLSNPVGFLAPIED